MCIEVPIQLDSNLPKLGITNTEINDCGLPVIVEVIDWRQRLLKLSSLLIDKSEAVSTMNMKKRMDAVKYIKYYTIHLKYICSDGCRKHFAAHSPEI